MNFKTFTLLSVLMLTAFMAQSQSLPIIHGKGLTLENQLNLLSHGQKVFSYMVEDGKVIAANYRGEIMEQVTGSDKATTMETLLGDKLSDYAPASSDAITLWKVSDNYILFDLSQRKDAESFHLKFYFNTIY